MEFGILSESTLLKGREFEKILVVLAITLIVLSTGLRIHMAASNRHALNDRMHYIELADNLYKGRGYVVEWILFPSFGWESIPHPDPHRYPLYPIFLAISYYLFGESLSISNILTAVFASLSIIIAYLIGIKLYNKIVGLIAIVIILSNYLYWSHSINALAAPVYGFFLTLSFYLLIVTLETSSKNKYWGLLGISVGLAWLTRPEGILILPTYLVIIYISLFKQKSQTKKSQAYKGLLILGLVVSLIMSPFFIRNFNLFGTPFHGTSKIYRYATDFESFLSIKAPTLEDYLRTHSFFDLLELKLINMGNLLIMLFFVISPIFFIFFIFGLIVSYKRHDLLYLVIIYILILIFALSLSFGPLFMGDRRYFSSLLPLISVIIGAGIFGILELSPNFDIKIRWTLYIFLILLLITPFASMGEVIEYAKGSDENVPRVIAARWLERNTLPSDVIMSRKVDIHYYSGHRKVVMIPFGPVSDIEYMVERYNVTYIMVLPNTLLLRPSLKDYVENKDLYEVYDKDGIQILKFGHEI